MDDFPPSSRSEVLKTIARVRPATAATLLTTLILLAPLAPPTLAQTTCGQWERVTPPAGATSAVLDVQARSADEAYAFAAPLGLIRWDGTAWSEFPISNLNGDYSIAWIEQLALVGSTHVFLAGAGHISPFSSDQLLRFWDGTEWSDWESLTLQPNIAGAPRNGAANAVVGVAPDDVWILGIASGFGDGVSGNPLLTVHWDGSRLTEYITPGPNNRQNNVYDGVAIASDDIWAVGTYNNTNNPDGHFRALTYHWGGTAWSHIPNPGEGITQVSLYTVTAIASNDVWAAGSHNGTTFFMHWDGTEWSIVPGPGTTGSIRQIAAIASNDVWAIDHPGQVPVNGKFYHWDGTAWSLVEPPALPPGATAVERHGGLAAVGACDVWAGGSVQYGQQVDPYIERLNGDPNATATPLLSSMAPSLHVTPNPVDHLTTIRFEQPTAAFARARLYDVRGQLVRTLLERGTRQVTRLSWDGRDDLGRPVSNGVYFLRAESRAGHEVTEKVAVLR